MYDVITIGSALVDIFVHSDQFQPQEKNDQDQLNLTFGDKVDIDSFAVYSGGGGSNTAVGFQRLGFSAAVVAELGRDAFADIVSKDLETERVSTALLVKERKEQTGGSIVLIGTKGDRVVMVHRGAAAQLGVEDLPVSELSRAHWLHLSSVGGQREVLRKVFSIAQEHSVQLSWNPGKAELALLRHEISTLGVRCNVLFLNKEEWESVTAVHSQLQTMIEHIVITDGDKGGEVIIKEQTAHRFQAKPVKAVDTTGAGDAFASGYVSALLLEKPTPVAIEWGLLNASANIQVVGAKTGLLRRAEIEMMEST
jgi:ribokinase